MTPIRDLGLVIFLAGGSKPFCQGRPRRVPTHGCPRVRGWGRNSSPSRPPLLEGPQRIGPKAENLAIHGNFRAGSRTKSPKESGYMSS
jgi:hypothetical protein